MSQMVEGAAKQALTVTNHAEVLNDAMVKNGLIDPGMRHSLIQQSSQDNGRSKSMWMSSAIR